MRRRRRSPLASPRRTAPLGVRTFMGRPGVMRRPWGPGWALVGDAGYWKDPISAHGLTDALRDAELLARAVISAGDGCVALDAALRGYQETRDRLSFRLFDVTDALGVVHLERRGDRTAALRDERLDDGRGRRDRRPRRGRGRLLVRHRSAPRGA